MSQHNYALKILAIGNSFSEDALEYLYHILKSVGFQEIVVANLYIGGCSLETHWNNAKDNLPAYRYDKNVAGEWQSLEDKSILHGLQDEVWDIVSLQQVSDLSGIASSYNEENRLLNLIDYVHKYKTNPDLKLAWQMTWAYQQDCTKEAFSLYGNDQFTMYQAIVEATQREITNNRAFDFVIPTGTSIQNLRSSYGDILTRDGFHLSFDLGRYVAGLTWFGSLTGLSLDLVTYSPVDPRLTALSKEAARWAIQNPRFKFGL